jgi:hypothetical protein
MRRAAFCPALADARRHCPAKAVNGSATNQCDEFPLPHGFARAED